MTLQVNVFCIEYEQRSDSMEYNEERQRKYSQRNKWIVTPSKSVIHRHSPPPIQLDDDIDAAINYFDSMNEDSPKYGQLLNIHDITMQNDAYLFIAAIDDKQSFIQIIDYIQNIKNNEENYNYRKPIMIIVTKCDLSTSQHQLTETDIAEFAIDIAVPFMLVTPDEFKLPFNRIIAAMRGYRTPSCFTKVRSLHQHDGAALTMTQSANGKFLYVGGKDGSIRVYDIQTSLCLAILLFHAAAIYKLQEHHITLSRQWWKPCKYLIACSADGQCTVWLLYDRISNISSRSEIVENVVMKKDFYGIVNAEMVANNGSIPLFVNCPRFVFKHAGKVRSFCVCDGNIVCTIGEDGRIKLWSLMDGHLLYESDGDGLGSLNDVVYVKELDKIFVASSNHRIYCLNVQNVIAHKDKMQILHGHADSVRHLKLCKKSKYEMYVISMDESGFIRCWNAKSPQHSYDDFLRHSGSIVAANVCHLNGDEHVLVTTSTDGTMRGYSIPDGDIMFNIADSFDMLSAVDCNANFIISAGRDCNVRCYEIMSDKTMEIAQSNVNNPLRAGLKWAYQRHAAPIHHILCGKKRFKHMLFTADKNGIILGWNVESGQCLACFGSKQSRNKMIKNPKYSVRFEFIFLIIQFLQLMAFTFMMDEIEWGAFNKMYNPLDIISDFILFDVGNYTKHLFDNLFVEWLICLFLFGIFFILHYISVQNVDYGTKRKEEIFMRTLSIFNWWTMKAGFIPILRTFLKVFVCDNMIIYVDDCWSSEHWIYILLSIIMLAIVISIHFKQIQQNQREIKRVHLASLRQNGLIILHQSAIIIMVIVSVFSLKINLISSGILLGCSATLCLAELMNPRYFSSKMNIVSTTLCFGVLWTYIWSMFLINEDAFIQMIEFSQFDSAQIDQMETIIHLCILPVFMLFGALLMFIRVHNKWFDQIRGGFRANLVQNGIGFISENVHSANMRKESGKIILKRASTQRSDDVFFKFHEMRKQKEYELCNQDANPLAIQNNESNSISAPQYSYRQSIDQSYPPMHEAPKLKHRVYTNSITSNCEMMHYNSVQTAVDDDNAASFPLNALQEKDDEIKSDDTSVYNSHDDDDDCVSTVVVHRNTIYSETSMYDFDENDDDLDTVVTFERQSDESIALPKRKETNAEDRDEFVLSAESFTKSPPVLISNGNHLDVPHSDAMQLDMKSDTHDSATYAVSIALSANTNQLLDSPQSDVTAFSAMEEIPDNIGDIFH